MTLLQPVFLSLALLLSAVAGDGFLGVTLTNGDGGAQVVSVLPGTAAAKSDIRAGDVITSVNKHATPDYQAFIDKVSGMEAGDEVRLAIRRGSRELVVEVVLGERPSDEKLRRMTEESQEEPEAEPVQEVAEEPQPLRRRVVSQSTGRPFLGVEVLDQGEGVEIAGLVEGGPAMEAGLREGDKIVRLGRRGEITSSTDLTEALGEMRPGQTVRVRVVRGGENENLSLTLGTHPDSQAAETRGGRVARRAMADAEERMKAAEAKAEKAEKSARAEAEKVAKKAREDAEKAAKKARAEAEKVAKKAREAAEKARAKAQKTAEKAQKEAAAAAKKAQAAAAKAHESHKREHGGEHGGGSELEALRKELAELRKEIRELKSLVRRLNR